jgi:hypothetical protein
MTKDEEEKTNLDELRNSTAWDIESDENVNIYLKSVIKIFKRI